MSGIEWTIEAKRWANTATDGVIESGLYFPYGKPDGPYAKAPAVKVRVREKKFWEATRDERGASIWTRHERLSVKERALGIFDAGGKRHAADEGTQ